MRITQLALQAAERRDHIESGGVLPLPQKRDVAAGRRPGGTGGCGRVGRETQRSSGPHDLYVDLPVVLMLPVPRESDLISSRRETRLALDPGEGGQRFEAQVGRNCFGRTPEEI